MQIKINFERRSYSVTEVSPVVRARVNDYLAGFGLVFAAFDFVVRPDGAWVFLQVNTTGEYGWVEHETDAPISQVVADDLVGGPDRKWSSR